MGSSPEASLRATVVYCTAERQIVIDVALAPGSTLRDAVMASGLPAQVPGLDPAALDLGVFGRPREAGAQVREGDRIEIYRPLAIDPKEARRLRAAVRRRRRG